MNFHKSPYLGDQKNPSTATLGSPDGSRSKATSLWGNAAHRWQGASVEDQSPTGRRDGMVPKKALGKNRLSCGRKYDIIWSQVLQMWYHVYHVESYILIIVSYRIHIRSPLKVSIWSLRCCFFARGLTPWDAFLPQDMEELMDEDHGGHQGVVAGLFSQRTKLGELIMIYCNYP